MNFDIQLTAQSRIGEVDFDNLTFGKIFSDHILIADYIDDEWQQPQIVPYGNMSFSPAMSVIHHGQSIFEGIKVVKNEQGEVFFFRLHDNFIRMNKSAERMCMPPIPEDIFMEGIKKLVAIDNKWIPVGDGKSLYVRPVYFATDEAIGVKPSHNYRFVIFTSPSGLYFNEPLKVLVETKYSRSSEGGVGFAKAAGNYGGAMYPTKLAQQKGYHQLIWLDAVEKKYIEESGAMNVMFVVGDTLLSPSLSNSKLAGITRESILTIARDWGMKVEERNISIDEIIEAHNQGILKEAFGTGTAAGIANIALIGYNDVDYLLPAIDSRSFSVKMLDYLYDLKTGKTNDPHNWVSKMETKEEVGV